MSGLKLAAETEGCVCGGQFGMLWVKTGEIWKVRGTAREGRAGFKQETQYLKFKREVLVVSS